jgi:tetratricopeptide (TPR) repeat protein
VGSQALADRYTYIPLTGIFIMLAWLAGDILSKWKYRQVIIGVAGAGILSVLGVISFVQAGYWRDTATLFEHCAAVTRDNFVVRAYRGLGFAENGDYELAVHEFEAALKFEPKDIRTFYNIAGMRLRQGKIDEAIAVYEQALKIDPANKNVQTSLEKARAMQKGSSSRQ